MTKVAGIEFSHLHMGDNLRMAFEHPEAEICGICHPDESLMGQAVQNFQISGDKVFTDWEECIRQTKPDLVILCPPTAKHAQWIEQIASYDVHIIIIYFFIFYSLINALVFFTIFSGHFFNQLSDDFISYSLPSKSFFN